MSVTDTWDDVREIVETYGGCVLVDGGDRPHLYVVETAGLPGSEVTEWTDAHGEPASAARLVVRDSQRHVSASTYVEAGQSPYDVALEWLESTADDDYHMDTTRIVVESSDRWRDVEIAAARSGVRTCTLVDSDSDGDVQRLGGRGSSP